MASKRNAAKKPYTPPSFNELDANAARAELEATGTPKDLGVKKMLSAIDEKLKESCGSPETSSAIQPQQTPVPEGPVQQVVPQRHTKQH